MKNIFDVLEAKESMLREKEEGLADLRREVEALRTAVGLLADETELRSRTHGRLSQAKMAEAILTEQGHEMHVKDISVAIEKKFDVKIKPNYLAPVLYRQIGNVFFKSKQKPNTFGLLTWTVREPTNGAPKPQFYGGGPVPKELR